MKYTGWCRNDYNAQGYACRSAKSASAAWHRPIVAPYLAAGESAIKC
jgi:hypothetical protein